MDPDRRIIELALEEDQAFNDVTTRLTVPAHALGNAVILAQESMVVAGQNVARQVFRTVDPRLDYTEIRCDGSQVAAGDEVARIAGCAASILQAERTALNFMQRMSGIATATRSFVAAAGHRVLDTRKTSPGMRRLDKYAVRVGGGINHRSSLADGILIKENHARFCGSVGDAVRRAKESCPHLLRVEAEVSTLDELKQAVDAGADIVLVDNMSSEQIRQAVECAGGKVKIEVSGGVVLDSLNELAQTGVDFISSGALTHSVKAVALSLQLYPLPDTTAGNKTRNERKG